MRGKPTATRSRADSRIESWIDCYVSGRWSLAEFEAHLEVGLPLFEPEDWLPQQQPPASRRRRKQRTAKQAAEAWSASAARAAENYAQGATSFQQIIQSGTWARPERL